MGSTYTAYVSKSMMERAAPLVDSGEFDTMSELLRFAIRTFYEWLMREDVTSLRHVIRGEVIKRNLPISDVVIEGILSRGLVSKTEIPDYALDHYLGTRGL